MNRIVTFGEIMLRLSPPGYLRFGQADSFDVTYGGGEANVAVSLANYGENVAFVTKLPDNPIGKAAVASLRQHGVSIENIAWGGDRIGIYFLEKGASQRPSKVVYDRKSSAIAQVEPPDFNWGKIFEGVQWFHFTGITPALGPKIADICKTACIEAKKAGAKISCDLNYRKKLWSSTEAKTVMSELMKYVDVCIANEEDAEKVFGIKAINNSIIGGELNRQGYESVAKELAETFDFEKVAITLRESISASDNYWSAMIYDGKECYFSKKYHIHIVDRVGGGDSFGGGLIYGLLNKTDVREALEFAVAASCLKHTVEGDFNEVTLEEVEALAEGDGSGRVQR